MTVEPCIMCGYALKLAGVRKVYFILANPKFGGLKSLMKIKGVDFEQVDYQTSRVVELLKRFYNIGNDKLDPNKRHRKPKTVSKDSNISKAITTPSISQNKKNNTNIFNLLGKRDDHSKDAFK